MTFKEDFLIEKNNNYSKRKPIYFKLLVFFIGLFLFVFACNIIFNSIFIKAQVVGVSMMPTYNIELQYENDANYIESKYKDVVFANKFENGTNNDIILLNMNNEVVIKRIIAVGGQTVELKKGNGTTDTENYYYYVDGILLNEEYLFSREDMNYVYFTRFCNNTFVNRNFNVEIINSEEAKFTVPDGQVFVLGDNRLVSGDSLIYGTVKKENILGKVCFSYKYNQNLLIYFWNQICSIF